MLSTSRPCQTRLGRLVVPSSLRVRRDQLAGRVARIVDRDFEEADQRICNPRGRAGGPLIWVRNILHRRTARSYRSPDSYRLRMLPAGGGLTPPPDVR